MQPCLPGEKKRYVVDCRHEGARFDRFLVDLLSGISRAEVQRLIGGGRARLNGMVVKAHHKAHSGDEVEIVYQPPQEALAAAEKIPLEVLYEDNDLLVINKRAGVIVHPAGRIVTGTLVNALLAHCENLSGIGGVLKPGIVHRLDKGTSGCILVAKNDNAHRGLADQFARREIRKEYLAIVHGDMREERGVIEGLIARHPVRRKKMAVRQDRGRDALTGFEVRERLGGFSYMKLSPRTGRTHQIRVHMSHVGHPVLGDKLYCGRKTREIEGVAVERPMLHAWKLSFTHPRSGRRVNMEAPLPADFQEVLNYLRGRMTI